MPCNSVAVISVALKVGTLEDVANNADALSAIHSMFEQLTGQKVRVHMDGTPPNMRTYFIGEGANYRYVVLSKDGMQLYGTFTPEQQAAIKAFIEGLPAALAEQNLVNALSTAFELLDDQPTLNETGALIGRQLVIRL